jgi:hypothetical protein
MKNRRVARSVSSDRLPLPLRDRPLRLRDPVDLLAAVPFLLGYHPSDSVVVVGVHRQAHLLSVRYDLPPPGADPDEYLGTRIADPVLTLRRQGVSAVLLVGYGPPERVAPSMRWLHEAYRHGGFQVLEALHMHDGRFRSVFCGDTSCCPAEGRPIELRDTRVAAECTVAGRVALPDREAYEAQLRPMGGSARQAMRHAAALADERLYAMLTHPPSEGTVERALLADGRSAILEAEDRHRRGERLDDDQVAWLAVLLRATAVRDVAWARITGGQESLQRQRELWLDVLRRCQPDVSVAPLSLFAFAAWRCGEGALARLALETALDLDPGHRMAADVLYPMVVSGLPPSAMNGFPWRMFKRRPGSRPRRRSKSRRAESRRE